MEFTFEYETEKGIEETLSIVKSTLKENGFGTLYELNFKDKFKEHDMAFDNNFYVLEVCNPKLAKSILDISEDIGYFLPCKVVVREEGNLVKVGALKPTSLLQMVTKDEKASEIAVTVEEVIKKSIETALK